jgi:hypothetical protein
MRALLVPLIVALFVATTAAQDARPPVKSIRDVKIGMSREYVLAGLSERYTLTKFEDVEGAYLVRAKDHPDDGESATILFSQGRAHLVTIHLYPEVTGEAVRFAQRLFFLLYNGADPPSSPDNLDKAANRRYITVPIELQDIRTDKLEHLDIGLVVGQRHFSIHLTKLEGYPDSVELREYVQESEPAK